MRAQRSWVTVKHVEYFRLRLLQRLVASQLCREMTFKFELMVVYIQFYLAKWTGYRNVSPCGDVAELKPGCFVGRGQVALGSDWLVGLFTNS